MFGVPLTMLPTCSMNPENAALVVILTKHFLKYATNQAPTKMLW